MNPNTKSMTQRKATEAEIRERFECLQGTLIERSRRLFAGSEALAFGYGGIAAAHAQGTVGIHHPWRP